MKRALAVLYVVSSLWWGPAAEAAFHLERADGSRPENGIRVRRVVYTPPAKPVRVVVASEKAQPAPAVAGRCHTAPGTPPQTVLDREVKGAGYSPTAYNFRGSGANGCWQFKDGTWAGYKGYRHAADAPVSVQNERAAQVWAGGRGCSHWASCGSS